MKAEKFKENLQVLQTKEKKLQDQVRQLKAKQKNLFKEYLKDEDTYKEGDILEDHEKTMILTKKDYSLNLITELPVIIYYGWACNKKGKRNKKDTRLTMFSYNLQ